MRRGIFVIVAAVVVAGCGRSDAPSPAAVVTPPPPPPPVKRGAWTFYGPAQGLSDDVQDVSADEGGNVYVAGGDALYAKRAGDQAFLRFDATNAGLTRELQRLLGVLQRDADEAVLPVPHPRRWRAPPPERRSSGSTASASSRQTGASWTYRAGGGDVVAFDPAKGTLARTRHVWFASPPHTICTKPVYGRTATCDPIDYWWD